MSEPTQLVWFKRDLRVSDHAPLLAASQSTQAVLPLYIVEPDYWLQSFASKRHWYFIRGFNSEVHNGLGR
jgi:deoxyribodipyrimidine photo-lyase